jgi:hypothetical protein
MLAVALFQPFNPALFFGSGMLLLLAGLAAVTFLLTRPGPGKLSLTSLARLNNSRRRARALTLAGVLAAGVFMVAGAGAFLQPARPGVDARDSGAGGFRFLAQTAMPLGSRLEAPDAVADLGLPDGALEGIEAVSFRVVAGDEASCLNLNQPAQPRLLGVDPERLEGRFTFAGASDEGVPAWSALEAQLPDGAVPAVVDRDTLLWSLKLGLGDSLTFADASGRRFDVRLVASLKDSVYQGSVLIDETRLLERFPATEGHAFFLLDAPGDAEAPVETLTRALSDYGFAATPTRERLARFNAVENSYIAVFQALGGLGVVLGTASLALVLLRSILERRGELALLRAGGFSRARVRRLLMGEALWLVVPGLACGLVAALVAVAPALRVIQPEQFPWPALALVGVAFVLALVAAGAAIKAGTRSVSFQALRDE